MRWLIILFLLLITVLSGLGTWGYSEFIQPGNLRENKIVVIPRGTSIERIAILLARNKVIEIPIILSIAARTLGAKKGLQAGEFSFPKNVSVEGVLDILQQGKQVVRRLTIAEGLTNRKVLQILEDTDGLVGKVTIPLGEGELLPETYYFTYGDRRNSLIKRMKNGMKNTLTASWANRSPDLPLSNIKDVLILASIVEKETGTPLERPRVAGVFLNRLRRNMRLQSDPTVNYSITKGQWELQRALTREDLKTSSPYNTYLINGLPPGAIANPGRAAIRAVVQPANTNELYFVADGTGGHLFAESLAEHNRNVAKWRKLLK